MFVKFNGGYEKVLINVCKIFFFYENHNDYFNSTLLTYKYMS